jgi:chorismate dehydratase
MMNETPPPYILKETEDGSVTLYSSQYQQTMHSLSGALEEAEKKHIVPSGIIGKLTAPVKVLDIGFGLGYNVLALLEHYDAQMQRHPCTIISCEKETTLGDHLDQIQFSGARKRLFEVVKTAYHTGTAVSGPVTVHVLVGDARETLRAIDEKGSFDAVFQDPYSPAHNPELWTVDFFRMVHRLMKPDGVLTTYSSALQIRRGLLDAGFTIGRGPSVGMKREGTIASPNACIIPLPEQEISTLLDDSKSIPYVDPHLNETREQILQRRTEKIREARLTAYRQAPQEPTC